MSGSSSSFSTGKIVAAVAAVGLVAAGAAYLFSGTTSATSTSDGASASKAANKKKSTKAAANTSTPSKSPNPADTNAPGRFPSPGPRHSPSSSTSSSAGAPGDAALASGFLSQQGPEANKSSAKRATEAFAKGQLNKAIELFTEAIQEDDTNNKLFTNRANVYIKLRRFEDALRDSTKSLALAQSPAGYLAKGESHLGLEQYEQAVTAFEDATRQEEASEQHKAAGRKGADKAVRLLVAAEKAAEKAAADALAASIPAPVTEPIATPPAVAEHNGQSYAAALAAADPKSFKQVEALLEQDVAATTAFRRETGSTANIALASSSVAPAAAPTTQRSSSNSAPGSDPNSEVDFNPDEHGNHDSGSDDSHSSTNSVSSGILVQHSDALPSSSAGSTPRKENLTSSGTLKESAVFVSASDASSGPSSITSPKLSPDVKSDLQTAAGRRQQKRVFKDNVQSDLVAQASRKQNKQALSALQDEVKSAKGKSPLKKAQQPQQQQQQAGSSAAPQTTRQPSKTFTAKQTAQLSSSTSSPEPSPEVVYNAATMHPSMLTASAVSTASSSSPPAASEESKDQRAPRGGRRGKNASVDQSAKQQGTPQKRQPSQQLDASAVAASSSDLSASMVNVEHVGPTPLTPPPASKTGWAKVAAASADKNGEKK